MLTGQWATTDNRGPTDILPSTPVHQAEPLSRRSAASGRESVGDLVRRAGKGDEQAWNELVDRFAPVIRRVAQRMGLNAADAADVQQTTWIQLMRRADQVRDPERIGAWLATTARRQSRRMSMAATRQAPAADPIADYGGPAGSADDVEDIALQDELHPALDRALARLPASYRQLLRLLTSNADPSYEEAARAMGLPVGSIGPMRIRALQMLRRDPGIHEVSVPERPPRRTLPTTACTM